MLKRRYIFLCILLVSFLTIACTSANESVDDFNPNLQFDDDFNDEYSSLDNPTCDDNGSNAGITEKDCCSFVIQEANNETIFAFRQDSPVTPTSRGIRIESQDWQGYNLIKQRIDSETDYFFHSIILENGWVISQGGSQYNDANRAIENITLGMVVRNEISTSSLEQLRQILIPYNYGHVFIKAPDGRFGIALVNRTFEGVLEPGEYLTIPNDIQYLDRGKYKDYGDDPVQAIIEICSWDESGENLRDQMTYHYKPQLTEEGLFYGTDLYVTNCNGINIGLNKSACVVPFYYKGVYYPTSVIPEYPGKLYVDTHIFKNTQVDNVIELINSINNPVVGEEIEIQYKVNKIIDSCTLVFELDKDTEFINAKVSTGSYYYDAQSHKLYWNISANRDDKLISIMVIPKTVGNHELTAYIEGTNISNTLDFYVSGNSSSDENSSNESGNPSSNINLNSSPATGNPILVLLLCVLGLLVGGFRFKK